MSTIPLPLMPQVSTSTPTALPPAIGSASVLTPPAALTAQFSSGQMLKVHVIDQLGNNQLQVQTSAGPMTLKTPLQAPAGTPLTLKMAMSGGEMTATIHAGPKATMMMAGQQTGQGQPQAPLQPGLSASQAGQGSAPLVTPAGSVAGGQLAPAQGGLARPAVTLPQVAGQQATGTAAGQTGQTATQQAASGTVRAAATAAVTPQVGASVPAILSQPAAGSALPQGANLTVTLLSLSGTPASGTPMGMVSGQMTNGQTLLSTSQGTLTLQTKSPIPMGTQVGFSVSASSVAMAQPSQAAQQMADLGETQQLTRNWKGLQQAVATLQTADPSAAQQLLNALPTPGPKLASALVQALNLFSGVRPGAGMPQLVGERPLAALDRAGGKGAVDRLERELGKLKGLSSDTTQDGWRAYSVPLQHDGEIDQIRMAVRHVEDDEEETGDGDVGTRFVLDLEMSQMGHLQLDGLVDARKRRFDLIFRSEGALQPNMRRDLTAIFTEAQQIGGMEGSLVFHVGANRFVPMPGIDDRRSGTAGLDV